MAAGGKDRETRESRERARRYLARQQYQAGLSTRRTRDNVVAAVVGGLLIVAAFVAQSLYFTTGPGAPEPVPTPVVTSTPTPTAEPTAEPSESVEPNPTETPEP
ncbi:dioxygenase [Microbacterium sp. R86528]|uniref:dioxygenase n=1 Tax=Microbacterium sp. R86528 TaxID=3093864 RepID=UPI0037CBA94D